MSLNGEATGTDVAGARTSTDFFLRRKRTRLDGSAAEEVLRTWLQYSVHSEMVATVRTLTNFSWKEVNLSTWQLGG